MTPAAPAALAAPVPLVPPVPPVPPTVPAAPASAVPAASGARDVHPARGHARRARCPSRTRRARVCPSTLPARVAHASARPASPLTWSSCEPADMPVAHTVLWTGPSGAALNWTANCTWQLQKVPGMVCFPRYILQEQSLQYITKKKLDGCGVRRAAAFKFRSRGLPICEALVAVFEKVPS